MWRSWRSGRTRRTPERPNDECPGRNRWRCSLERNFEKLWGFKAQEFSSFQRFTELLYRPTNPASLGVVRALFGLCMVVDVVEERGFADIDVKWGDPLDCHFPLIHGMKPPPLPWMIVVYTAMWTGAFGMMLGFRFKAACCLFVVAYWYIFLLDKSYWNNHTYLYGIVATILWGTDANKYLSLDASQLKQEDKKGVPLWNYFILRFQFFLLYFLAGLKKSSREWLEGYAMLNLSRHWVFSPFKLFLTTEQTDYLIVHWFAFIFDLTIGFWMLLDSTRLPAMIFCATFHLMNSRLFSIGMFPYVCLATMPLFCNTDWPERLAGIFKRIKSQVLPNRYLGKVDEHPDCRATERADDRSMAEARETNTDEIDRVNDRNRKHRSTNVKRKERLVVCLLLLHVALQFFLPYSHFITKGYNNWVPGLYGYSWDMMVHTWDTILVVIRVHDNDRNEDLYLEPKAWVQNDRWEKHGDMARQYAFCIKENLLEQRSRENSLRFSNLSIYMDVWCSLNGRFQQRIFDPRVDLLKTDWHPFKPIPFLMPLLTQYNSYRLEEIQRQVHGWSNETDVLFVADFPGMHLDNYITPNFTNVSLVVLEGEVAYTDNHVNDSVPMSKGSSMPIRTAEFHRVLVTSSHPACYMYTYYNPSMGKRVNVAENTKDSSSIMNELRYKVNAWTRTFGHMANAFFYFVYDVPMVRRINYARARH